MNIIIVGSGGTIGKEIVQLLSNQPDLVKVGQKRLFYG
jgi:N-acetyl-gamma-glutamylphosphate reductase